MNGKLPPDETLAAALKRATNAINDAANPSASGGAVPAQINGGHSASVGEENARRLRQAAENTARMVEEQAAERLAVAESTVEEAKALQAKAKDIADGIRAAAEVEAKRAIELTGLLDETDHMLEHFGQKFSNEGSRAS